MKQIISWIKFGKTNYEDNQTIRFLNIIITIYIHFCEEYLYSLLSNIIRKLISGRRCCKVFISRWCLGLWLEIVTFKQGAIIDIIFYISGSVNLRPSVTESDSFVTSHSFMRWEVSANFKIEFMKPLLSTCLGT